MKQEQRMTEQTLIDRYVFEVGNHLPRANRDDVLLELRSILHDMLEERGLEASKKEDTDEIVALLKEFGNPEQVAASYQPERYLVGPQLFPIYELVVMVVWSVMTGFYVLGLLLGGIRGEDLLPQLAGFFGNYTQTLLYTLGIITVVFFLLQRAGVSNEKGSEKEEEWDPRKLPKVEDPDRLKRGELIADIVFTVAALVVFNAFLDQIRIPLSINGVPHSLTLFNPEFKAFVPMLSIVWAADLALKSFVLARGAWAKWTRAAEALISGAMLYVMYRIITEAVILDLAILDMLIKWVLWIVVVVLVVDLIGGIYRLFFPGRNAPWKSLRLGAQDK
jgi:hypothetical protein